MKLHWLLVFIPVAIALDYLKFDPILVFVASALAIVPLAGLMGDATEALAEYLGPTVGGLLNATLGNAPEIIISLFALNRGLIGIVKSSLTGSIIGNLLLGLGLSMVAGGMKVGTQKFDSRVARINGALLVLASFGLIIPAIYRIGHWRRRRPRLGTFRSRSAVVLSLLVYLGQLWFSPLSPTKRWWGNRASRPRRRRQEFPRRNATKWRSTGAGIRRWRSWAP